MKPFLVIAAFIAGMSQIPISSAASLEDIQNLMSAFGSMKMRIINSRKIAFWDAKANETAHCWLFYVEKTIPPPATGQGFYADQWTMSSTSAIVREDQCYAQP